MLFALVVLGKLAPSPNVLAVGGGGGDTVKLVLLLLLLVAWGPWDAIGCKSEKSPDFRACAFAAALSLSLSLSLLDKGAFMVENNVELIPTSLSRRFWNNAEMSWFAGFALRGELVRAS